MSGLREASVLQNLGRAAVGVLCPVAFGGTTDRLTDADRRRQETGGVLRRTWFPVRVGLCQSVCPWLGHGGSDGGGGLLRNAEVAEGDFIMRAEPFRTVRARLREAPSLSPTAPDASASPRRALRTLRSPNASARPRPRRGAFRSEILRGGARRPAYGGGDGVGTGPHGPG